MNKYQRSFLRIVGVLLICAGVLILLWINSNPDLEKQIYLADQVCNVKIGGLELGELAQQITKTQSNCSKAHFLMFIIKYHWILYLIGAILFLIGVWGSLGAKESVKKAGFKEGDELEAKAKKGEIRLRKGKGR